MMRIIRRSLVWLMVGSTGSVLVVVLALWSVEYQSLPKISSGGHVLTSFWDRGFVSGKGTWVIEGSHQAFPRQTTEISCYRDEKECRSAQAEIALGDTLSVSTEQYNVTTWDANTIVFTSTAPLCVIYVYTISRANERITGQRKPKPTRDESCKFLEQRVLNLTMRDGIQVWQELHANVASKIYPYMWGALGMWWAFVIYKIARHRSLPI